MLAHTERTHSNIQTVPVSTELYYALIHIVSMLQVYFVAIAACLTWDVDAVVFDVHLVQACLCRGILHCDSAVLVIRDVRLGHFPRWHSHVA